MKSVFTSRDYETNWSPVFEDSGLVFSEPTLELFLSQKVKGSLKRSLYHISNPYLLEISQSGSVESYLDVSLMLFEAFIEDSDSGVKPGFHLNGRVFYTESEEDLDLCIKVFQKICVFCHIEDYFVQIKEIGVGSTSIVYLAEDIQKKNQFAIKCIKKSYLVKPQSLRNLTNEIKIMRKIDHKNICKLYSVFEDDDQVYLVLEYVQYGSLLKLVSDFGALDEKVAVRFMRSFVETLEYLHSNDIVHRDLKLENILISKNLEEIDFKIIDLGLAYISQYPQRRKCGSPGYVAPEMLRDEEYDNKIDIFSTGVVLYIILHGKHPFEARDLKKILTKNLECRVKVKKQVSELAADCLKSMLDPLPEMRPRSSQLLEHPWLAIKPKVLNIPSIVTCVSSNPA
jgi:tRNA A-37 threonylcarbamoyl transferase component Bud32